MNKTNKQFKKYLNKLLANVICLAMLLNIAPLFGFLKVGAEVFYDNSLGNYYENKGILIAEPYENAAFRGWYSKTGEEVSIDKSFVIPSGKTANDYIPVFYNLNLLENPSFEEVSEYSNWFSVTDSSAFEITANEARTGEQALEIIPKNSAVYCDLSGLEKNTQYRIDFNYKAQDSLKFVSVISADEEVNNSANLYDGEFLAQCSQSVLKNNFVASAWNYTSITFFSYEETSVKLALLYEGESFFVDDMALIEDNMTSASYLNNEFDNYNSESEADNLYLNFSNSKPEYTKTEITDSGWLKVASTRNTNIMSSKGILFKKGAKYTFRAKVDISEFEHKYVPKLDNEGNVIYDASGNIVYDQVVNNGQIENMLNWINFTFSTESGNTGSETDDTYVTSGDSQISSEFIVKNEDGYILVHKTSKTSGFGFGIESIKNISDRSNLSITMTFTAEKNCVGYFNIRNNGCETFYIDYITLEENNVDTDIKSVVQNYALKTVGTAIRTEGKQGIRHKTSLDKILLTADNNYGIRFVEYGTLAIKTEYLGENNLVLNGKYVFEGKEYQAKKGVAYSFNSKIDKIFAEGRNTVDFTAVLVNIAEENWNNDYTVRAYFKYQDKNGNIDVIYANPFDVAVYPVAKEAYSAKNEQGGYAETDGVRTYLYKNIITRFTDKIITIKDNTSPLYSNFQGISSTVYHATAFFPDSHGRSYTDEMASIEMDRLVDSKVNNVRTRFDSHWMWTNSGWNWNSTKMKAVYKWAKMLQDRGITITLNLGWSLRDFLYYYDFNKNNNLNQYSTNGHSSIPEVEYLHGVGEDIYGEDLNTAKIEQYPNLNLSDAERSHFSIVAARYAEWGKQALNAFKTNGIYNVEYILPFTESGYSLGANGTDQTKGYDEWIMIVMALHDSLKQEGIRENYKIIGPSQSLYKYQNREIPFVEYVYNTVRDTEFENMLNINSMHQYTTPNINSGYENSVYDPIASYSTAAENFPYYQQILNNAGVADMEFWCDEYFATAPDAKWWDGVGMQMTQFAAGLTAGINNGVNRFLTWQMFDTLWDSEAVQTSGEFAGGVHVCGTCPSLVKANGDSCTKTDCACKNYEYSSYVPRVTYYGINLLGKYLNNKNALVFSTNIENKDTDFEGGVYASTINNDMGKTVVLVVNTMPIVSTVNVNFEKDNISGFKRYVYNPDEIEPSADATSITSDKNISLNGRTSFKDVIPAGSFAIYVQNGVYVGDDFEMDME